MNRIANDILMHYGIKRRSGRYPYGSGENPYQHEPNRVVQTINNYKAQGLSEKDIAKKYGMSTTELRMLYKLSNHKVREELVKNVEQLRSEGKTLWEIANELGLPNESSVRSLLNASTKANKEKYIKAADILRRELEEKGMIDVSEGVNLELGVSPDTLREALTLLQTEGYNLYNVGFPQMNNARQQTVTQVLTKPEVEYGEAYKNRNDIQSVTDYHSTDGGSTWDKIEYPASIDSKRIDICYGDQGGSAKDGVIEIRPGAADLDLGNSHYAQVRIMVDGTHYLKGMAMYADDLPEGVDIRFNTNKQSGTDKMDVLKPIQEGPNPFGSYIKANGQSYYIDENGERKLSAINKLREEGDYGEYAKTISSQFLSKQPMKLINQQLKLTYADYEDRYSEIMSLTNNNLKKKMLQEFGDECDTAAVSLKAMAFPRQQTQVILPLNDISDNEVYAPNYRNGEQVALIRYPHGGTFEIPILTVNNKNEQGNKILGPDVKDAVGINTKVAQRLSGADFDGDTVTVIPIKNIDILSTNPDSSPALRELKNFDPKTAYPYHEGITVLKKGQNTQREMGMVSNLINDMTLKGADNSEVARAVKHSMVVIDAAKHKLDYKQSEKDNDIQGLKKAYQDGGGASTLISRHKQDYKDDEHYGSPKINPETGEKEYKTRERYYTDKSGKQQKATTDVKLILKVKDVHELSSGTPQEEAYADYANKMKALGNRSRKESLSVRPTKVDSNARKEYQDVYDNLISKVNVASMNAPRERQAQRLAAKTVEQAKKDNPELATPSGKGDLRKVGQTALNNARAQVGASSKEKQIKLSDRDWEAIQKGVFSDTQLTSIFKYADQDLLKERALPNNSTNLSQARINKIQAMKASGYYTNAEIADAVGCSVSTVSKYANG